MSTSGPPRKLRKAPPARVSPPARDSAPTPYGRCSSIARAPYGSGPTPASTGFETPLSPPCRFPRLRSTTSASWLEIKVRYGPGNRSLPLTHVAADGRITSFPRTLGTICIRRDRDGTIWSAGGVDARLYRSSGVRVVAHAVSGERGGPGRFLWLSIETTIYGSLRPPAASTISQKARGTGRTRYSGKSRASSEQ